MIDGAKALAAGVTNVFGELALIQRCTLTFTNAIESMISVARDTTRNVKGWLDEMVKRWVAAGMRSVERSFRRSNGCDDMPILVAALRAHADRVTPACETEEVV